MYLLVDECCADGLATVARKAGHTAQLTKEVGELGRGATDEDTFSFARRHDAVLVTVNASDFRDLARHRSHAGVVLLPSVREPGQSRLFRAVLPVAAGLFTTARDRFVEIDVAGRVSRFTLP